MRRDWTGPARTKSRRGECDPAWSAVCVWGDGWSTRDRLGVTSNNPDVWTASLSQTGPRGGGVSPIRVGQYEEEGQRGNKQDSMGPPSCDGGLHKVTSCDCH